MSSTPAQTGDPNRQRQPHRHRTCLQAMSHQPFTALHITLFPIHSGLMPRSSADVAVQPPLRMLVHCRELPFTDVSFCLNADLCRCCAMEKAHMTVGQFLRPCAGSGQRVGRQRASPHVPGRQARRASQEWQRGKGPECFGPTGGPLRVLGRAFAHNGISEAACL